MKIEFLRASEVGVSGPWGQQLSLVARGFGGSLDGQNFFPIRPIAIFDADSHGGPDGFFVPPAGENIGSVFLDFLASSAAVSQLPPAKLTVDEFQVHGQGSGQPGDKRQERLPM